MTNDEAIKAAQRLRAKNYAVLAILLGFVALMFLVTMVRMG